MKPAKIRYLFTTVVLLKMLFASGQNHYTLKLIPVDKDSSFAAQTLQAKEQFDNKEDCMLYIDQLIPSLQTKGYITASLDSIKTDSASAVIHLFFGEIYKWTSVNMDAESKKWLSLIGWNDNTFRNENFDHDKLITLQNRMLSYFENRGHPFAKIYMDDLKISGNEVSGKLKVEPGPLYHIDSIKISGTARVSNEYLQQFLDIENGSVYNKQKLRQISNQLRKLNYIEEKFPAQLIWGSTGGTVEVFIDQKKSSQVNLIVGLLPNSDALAEKKLLITGEGLLNLKNAFGAGETIGLVWQRLQAASQQLNIVYQQPYIFKSPLGIDFAFNMQKRDSAFLNFNFRLGGQFNFNPQQYVQLYAQRFSSILNVVDTAQVIALKQLPEEADVRLTSVGVEYGLNTTNYVYNPVSGLELTFNTSVGNKIVKPNNQVLELSDPNNPDFNFSALYDTVKTQSYQLKSVLNAAKYFPLGKANRNTIKAAINGGYIAGRNIFRNELFQIGGYHLLRGFDEQSQFLSQYGIGTVEYRYLVGENSYFNVFADGGWGKDGGRGKNVNYTYLSGGLGLAFETKVGLFRLAWAVGKRNDTNFNLRQSKIHFGFVNYF